SFIRSVEKQCTSCCHTTQRGKYEGTRGKQNYPGWVGQVTHLPAPDTPRIDSRICSKVWRRSGCNPQPRHLCHAGSPSGLLIYKSPSGESPVTTPERLQQCTPAFCTILPFSVFSPRLTRNSLPRRVRGAVTSAPALCTWRIFLVSRAAARLRCGRSTPLG